MTTYEETIDYLYSQLPMFQKMGKKAIKPKLTNITELCNLLGNPQNNFKSIHVAGTNGKGSTSHFLTSIFMESGLKVGLYTSPHLKDFRERFRINGTMVPENWIIEFVQDYWLEIQNLRPSFFEVSVALAFKIFSDEKVDVAVIEVGLGGKYDSTNIISNVILSHISNIGFDHVDILGDTLEKIAFEKAGIIKPGVPVVISEYTPETKPVFTEIAREKSADIYFAQDNMVVDKVVDSVESLHIEITNKNTGKSYSIDSQLVGEYQQANILGVIASVERLRDIGYMITDSAVERGFRHVVDNTSLKGRWQILSRNPLTICDTGHNEQAFEITINRLKKEASGKIFFILGFVKDKDTSRIQELVPSNSELYLVEFDSERALRKNDLEKLEFANANKISIMKNVNLAIEQARSEANEEDIIFIGGSTYLVAEINNL
jgi:dihydrofolate synthase/folylpolyglutamate synthase